MDEADIADILITRTSETAIMSAGLAKPEAYFCGVCMECEEPVAYPLRWCTPSCRDTWSLRKANRLGQ